MAARTAHTGSRVIWNQQLRHGLKIFKGVDVTTEPGSHLLIQSSFGIGVVARAQHHQEQPSSSDFARLGILDGDGSASPIDKTLLTRRMVLAQNHVLLPEPAPVQFAEATVAVSLRMCLPILFPSQLQSQMTMLLELLLECGVNSLAEISRLSLERVDALATALTPQHRSLPGAHPSQYTWHHS